MYLASYLDELFSINRHFGNLGMVFYRVLELAIAHSPMSYEDLIATKRPRAVPPAPPQRADTRRTSSPPSEPPVENCLPGFLRLNGYPRYLF